MHSPAQLITDSGLNIRGRIVGARIPSSGEVVFTTAPTGYVETLTDPSYFGQIIVFAYPLIGNYGVPKGDLDFAQGRWESRKIFAKGVIVTKDFERAFHWEAAKSFHHWLEEEGIPCLSGVDTRMLVQHIRDNKKVIGKIVPDDHMPETVNYYDVSSENVLPHVSVTSPLTIGQGPLKIGFIDCGAKWTIARKFLERNVRLEILPWDFDFKSADVDAFFLSNGPGDPARTDDLPLRVKELLTLNKPILGICLGHQIIALAAGGKTHRLPFGHRGANHPVQLVGTQKGFLTSQNHGYVVDETTLSDDWTPWFINANDGTNEGMRHKTLPIMSVQFHPEAAGGPQDTEWIFDQFIELALKHKETACLSIQN